MPATKIMIVRHAEKPSADGSISGVSQAGAQDPDELVVRGWQRSGALARYLEPLDGQFINAKLATPDAIFASALAHHSKSLRPQHTVLALADLLGLQLVLSHAKGDEVALVADVLAADGTVLIAWEHERIPFIANTILGNATTCPQSWPDDRFDLVWIFDRRPGSDGWDFDQVPQMLLPGDKNSVIAQP
jgi:broad specificity phosphatase PhoE